MRLGLSTLCLILWASISVAQQAAISLSTPTQNAQTPVEITADRLEVQQASGTAEFRGNAKAAQGDLRLAAGVILVRYSKDGKGIDRIEARNGVTFTNGIEIAEAREATFLVSSRDLKLSGDVVLVQGNTAISGDVLDLDLATNSGVVTGNVKTIFVPTQ